MEWKAQMSNRARRYYNAVGSIGFAACVVFFAGPADSAETASTVKLKARMFAPAADLGSLGRIAENGSRHVYVQLSVAYTPSMRSDLRARGVHLLRYVPDHTWIASVTPEAAVDPMVRSSLRWAEEIDPYDKMPARFAEGDFGSWAVTPDGRIELNVRLHDDLGAASSAPLLAEVEARIGAIGAEVLRPLPIFPGFTVRAFETDLPAIAALDAVLWMSEIPPVPETENDGTRARVRANDAQDAPYHLSGQGVVVAVNDGGQVAPHEDFDARLLIAESDVGITSHGTHVAGTLAGSGVMCLSEGGSDRQWRGIAPEATIVSYDYYDDIVQEMMDGILPYDLDVHNNSWGYGVSSVNCATLGDYDFISPDLDSLVLGAAGKKVSIIFSGGNERDDGDCPLIGGGYGSVNPPKAAKNIIAVGATESDTDGMTDFSSWGPVDDGRLKPDLTAPGCEVGGEGYIHSTLPDPFVYGGNSWCGTSMAAPVVSGAIALMLQERAALGDTTDVEPSLMKAVLASTAIDLGNPGPDYAFGHGRVDIKRAVDAIGGDTPYVFDVGHGESYEFPFNIPPGLMDLRVVLAWDDPDASPGSSPALINDIDLVLIDPSSNVVYPWVLSPSDPAANATRGIDTLNNIEHVATNGPAGGAWIARITGTNVPEGPQRVSLAGLDVTPPAAPDSFAVADTASTSVSFTWIDDRPVDFRGTVLVRSEGGIFWPGPTNGQNFYEGQSISPFETVVYVGTEDRSTTPFVDDQVLPNTPYIYRAYSFDDWRVYSPVATVEVTTPGPTDVASSDGSSLFALHPARPNPALGSASISFSIPESGAVELTIFDPAGRRVRQLVSATLSAGTHVRKWDGRDDRGHLLASGMYFYELRAGEQRATLSISWIR